jgi:hypothetical protein
MCIFSGNLGQVHAAGLAVVLACCVVTIATASLQAQPQKPRVQFNDEANPPVTSPATKPPATPGVGPDTGTFRKPPFDVTKDVGVSGVETSPPCAPAREPYTECRSGQLWRCKEGLSHFGNCQYEHQCLNTNDRC